jgi:hypothetical protein
MDTFVCKLIRDVANMPDEKQIEVFHAIACFPAITLPVLEMASIELGDVVESSRNVPLQDPATANPARSRQTQRRLMAEEEEVNDEDSEEEQEEEIVPKKRTNLCTYDY